MKNQIEGKKKKKIFQQKKYFDQNFPLTELPEPPVDVIAFDNRLDARNIWITKVTFFSFTFLVNGFVQPVNEPFFFFFFFPLPFVTNKVGRCLFLVHAESKYWDQASEDLWQPSLLSFIYRLPPLHWFQPTLATGLNFTALHNIELALSKYVQGWPLTN